MNFFEETYDSKNWTFLPKNLRIDPSLPIWLTPRIQAFWTFSYDSKSWTLFHEYDSKNWTTHFFSKWLKDLNLFWNMTQWIELFFNLTQRIELFQYDSRIEPFLSLRRIEPFSWRKELNPFFGDSIEHFSDPKNWTFFLNTTHRSELFFWNVTQRIERIFKNLTQRIEPSSQNDTNNWTFLKIIWLQDFKFFCDSGDGTFFNLDQGIEAFFFFFFFSFQHYHSKMIDLFWTWLSKLNLVSTWLTELNPFNKTWFIEIEPFFSTWLKENESIFSMTSRIFLFYKVYDSIELIVFGKYDSKNWNFWKKKGL